MQAAIGGNNRYSSLQAIADLFRAKINDTANNTGGSGTGTGNQAGLIMPNTNPDLLTLLDSAIRELYSDLRNIGDPELIIDNYLLLGIPALTQPNPAVQVALSYAGYFNGFTWSNTWKLPFEAQRILAVWERESNVGESFSPMRNAAFGLPGCMQGQRMGQWEMREGIMWMPGCLMQTDLRIRCRIEYPSFLNPATINFASAYVPILGCANAVASKMMINYAMRFSPDLYGMAVSEEARQMDKLKLEVVRAMQLQENQRSEFGGEAVDDFAISWAWL